MKLSNSTLLAAVFCCLVCVMLSIAAISLDQYTYSRIDPYNRMALCLDNYHNLAHWAYLLYDLFHLFVIGVFALVLAEKRSWEAWMGGGASIISTLADMASVGVDIFILTTGLRALALGGSAGFAAPEAGYEFIRSTFDFASAAFGIFGTLFLGSAAIKAKGTQRMVGWFLLATLPLGFLQFAEVGLEMPWTFMLDSWITPLAEIVLQVLFGIALWTTLRERRALNHSEAGPGAIRNDPLKGRATG